MDFFPGTDHKRPNIHEPRWDQDTYMGRAKHFFLTTNPLNLFASSERLERSREIVTRYKKEGDSGANLTEDELWSAKQLYDSAYHPETDEKVFILGRMSAQVPVNATVTGCMLNFYKSRPAVIFWQFVNQSVNTMFNYCNRAGDAPISNERLAVSYTCATTGAVIAALGFGSLAKNASPLIKRLIPFTAVIAGNGVNLPIIRSRELMEGIPVYDERRNQVGISKIAARDGIALVVATRLAVSVPTMIVPPIVMNQLERMGVLRRNPRLEKPLMIILVALCLTFATPLCCALFPQNATISLSRVEPELQESVKKLPKQLTALRYNKGL